MEVHFCLRVKEKANCNFISIVTLFFACYDCDCVFPNGTLYLTTDTLYLSDRPLANGLYILQINLYLIIASLFLRILLCLTLSYFKLSQLLFYLTKQASISIVKIILKFI